MPRIWIRSYHSRRAGQAAFAPYARFFDGTATVSPTPRRKSVCGDSHDTPSVSEFSNGELPAIRSVQRRTPLVEPDTRRKLGGMAFLEGRNDATRAPARFHERDSTWDLPYWVEYERTDRTRSEGGGGAIDGDHRFYRRSGQGDRIHEPVAGVPRGRLTLLLAAPPWREVRDD